jgi:hypothetical protein
LKLNIRSVLMALAAPMILFQSCSKGEDSPKTVTVTSVNYNIDNTPADWWSDGAGIALSYRFWVNFSGDIAANDIASVRVYLPGDSAVFWAMDAANGFDAKDGCIFGSGFSRSIAQGENVKELPIGTMKAEITLTNKAVSYCYFNTGYPGNLTAAPYTFAFSEDEASADYPGTSAAALRRPSVSQLTNDGASVAVTFAANDARINNGHVWFYDASGKYIGWFGYFREKSSGAVSGKLAGTAFHTDGTSNTITLSSADILDSNSAAISSSVLASIAKCRVLVTDGTQYSSNSTIKNGYVHYDYRAISPLFGN